MQDATKAGHSLGSRERETRDFRVDTIGRAYKPTELKEAGDGIFNVDLVAPLEGLESLFRAVRIRHRCPVPLRLSTAVKGLAGNTAVRRKTYPQRLMGRPKPPCFLALRGDLAQSAACIV